MPPVFHCLLCGDSCRPSTFKVAAMLKMVWVWDKWGEVLPLLLPGDPCPPPPSKEAKVCPKCKDGLEQVLDLAIEIKNLEKLLKKSVDKVKTTVAESQKRFVSKSAEDSRFRKKLIDNRFSFVRTTMEELWTVSEAQFAPEMEAYVEQVEINVDCDSYADTEPLTEHSDEDDNMEYVDDQNDPDFRLNDSSPLTVSKTGKKRSSPSRKKQGAAKRRKILPKKKYKTPKKDPEKREGARPRMRKPKKAPEDLICRDPDCVRFNQQFSRSCNFSAHLKTHRSPPKVGGFTCPLCNGQFHSQERLASHTKSHGDHPKEKYTFDCPDCPLKFLSLGSLSVHRRKKHGIALPSVGQRPTEKCPVCQLWLKPSSMEYHSWTHKGLEDVVQALNTFQSVPEAVLSSKRLLDSVPKDFEMKCAHCRTTWTTFTMFVKHLKAVHSDLSQKQENSSSRNIEN